MAVTSQMSGSKQVPSGAGSPDGAAPGLPAEERYRLEEIYRTIVRGSMDGFWLVDAEARFLDVNEAYCELIGYSREELLKMRIPDIEAIENPEETAARIRKIMETGSDRFESRHRCKDGRIIDIEVSANYLKADEGRFFTFLRDITERKAADEEFRLYGEIIGNMQEGVYLIRVGDGMIVFTNPKFEKMFGYGPGEMVGKNVSIVNAPSVKSPEETASEIQEALKKTGAWDGEVHNIRKDGTPFWCHAVVSTFEHHRYGTVWLAIHRDITERKCAEEALKKYAAELESANKELEAFSYSVSHDLRTPLRAIDGFSRILLEEYQNRLDDEGQRLLNVVRDNTRKMAQLIDDILAFSRIGRQEMALADVDMELLARDVMEELAPAMSGRNVRLNIGPLPPARADRAMLRRVLGNLLGNAVKFTRPRAMALIEVSGRIEGNEICYTVRDNGVGFDMQYAGKLFGVFQRLHGQEEFEGTGIGLAIVKRIVTRHGGRVWAEGKVGEGAAIHFTLPGERT